MILICVAIVLAYLLGSISFAVVVSRAFGLADPRSYGSGNPGATNVLRGGNKVAAALTLLLDAAKGWLAVWGAQRAGLGDVAVALAAVAVFLGHLYPLYFRFKGGKGVATALGVLVAVAWWLGLYTALTWLIVFAFFRYSSLAALSAALFAPLFYILLVTFDATAIALIVISLLVFYRHRSNISNLIKGTERRIGSRAP